jgi:hypothetical protein
MSSLLSRVAAIGIVAGGFALTGDLGRLASRGMRVLNASDVPAPRSAEPAPVEQAAAPTLTAVPEAATPTPLAAPSDSPSGGGPGEAARPAAAAPLIRAADLRPPAGGPEEVSLSSLSAGSRVVIWLAVRRGAGPQAFRCLVLDLVDPAAAEALLYEAVSFTADGRPAAAASAPRRIRLAGEAATATIRREAFLAYRSLGTAAVPHATEASTPTESLGPIVALDVTR